MTHPILGLHHVTATVDDAQADLDFCLDALGLRLVKKTVNFDNHDVYHFYYGDERGTPGTIWTTFPYKGKGVAVGTKGAGQVVDDVVLGAGCARSTSGAQRLTARGVAVDGHRAALRRGRDSRSPIRPACRSSWSAPSATRARRGPATAWARPTAIRGLHSVTMTRAIADATLGCHDRPARLPRRQRGRATARGWRRAATARATSSTSCVDANADAGASTASAPCITSRWRFRQRASSCALRERAAAGSACR